jgi:Glycosyltransferase family 87
LAIVGGLATIVTALLVAYSLTGFPLSTSYDEVVDGGFVPDVLHERAEAWEAVYGDPYRSIGEIMVEHGYPNIGDGISPRTPGALLLQLPFLLVPESYLLTFAVGGVLVFLAVGYWCSHLVANQEWWRFLVVGPIVVVTFPIVTAIFHGTVTITFAMTLILVAWAFPDSKWAGVALGIAVASRVWPALIVIGFWIDGRRRLAVTSLATAIAFTSLGLLLPGVTLPGTFQALANGAGAWMSGYQNASLSHLLSPLGVPTAVTVAGTSLVVIALALRNRARAVSLTSVGSLIASPLSWPAYMTSALPVFARGASEGRRLFVGLLLIPLLAWPILPYRLMGYFLSVFLVGLFVLALTQSVTEDGPTSDLKRLSQ